MAPLPQTMTSVPPKAFSKVILSIPVAAGPVSSRTAGRGAGFSPGGLATALDVGPGVGAGGRRAAGLGVAAGRTALTWVAGPAAGFAVDAAGAAGRAGVSGG